jgi:DNA-directed RNA polymerase specialized sigma24 family protein
MPNDNKADAAPWLQVIAKALAYQCLLSAIERDPEKYKEVLAKVEFLEAVGLSQADAAEVAGSTAGSVSARRSQMKKEKDGKTKKKTRRTKR